MSRPIYYTYNSETNNFERVFPSLRSKLLSISRLCLLSLLIGIVLFLLFFYWLDTPTERKLREENEILETQYSILNRRLDDCLAIMENIRNRDDNFYRVMMQMEPMPRSQRYAGLDNDNRYQKLGSLSDGGLTVTLTKKVDLFQRQLFAQEISFNQLKETISRQKEKLLRIPAVLPIDERASTLSSGFGVRRDPMGGEAKFHPGIDFAAPVGTPVYATADGRVEDATRSGSEGMHIIINHGYDYQTHYAHLNEMSVTKGQFVRRGDVIGKVGSTGKSTAPHLHYEVIYRQNPQDPVNFFFKNITPSKYSELIQQAENAGNVLD